MMPRKRIPRSTIVPVLLLVYLGVMAYIGWPEYAAGHTSALYYYGIIVVTLVCIVLLHFSLKRRDRLRRERQNLSANCKPGSDNSAAGDKNTDGNAGSENQG